MSSATSLDRAENVQPRFDEAAEKGTDATVHHFPDGEQMDPELAALAAQHPELAEKAAEIGLNQIATRQFILQSIALEEARPKANGKPRELVQQPPAEVVETRREQEIEAGNREIDNMFSSAFAHIPADSPFLPK